MKAIWKVFTSLLEDIELILVDFFIKNQQILEYSFLLRINQNTIRTPGMNHFNVIFYSFFPGLVTEKPIGPKLYIKKNIEVIIY